MKKLLLTISAIGLMASSVFAQQNTIPNEHRNIYVKGQATVHGKNVASRGANDVSTWYSYVTSYEEDVLLGQKLPTYVSFIYPDTTGYIVYSDGQKLKSGFHVVGSMFDPKDSTFLATGEQVLTKFNPYTVDSIAWTQFYIRQLDSVNQGGMKKVVDTLFIQYFDITGIDVASYVYQGNPIQHYYGQPKRANYKPATRLNSGALRTDTILLDDSWADSVALNGANTSFFGRGVQLKVGLNSKSTNTTPIYNNVFAWAITFKPMVKTALGDTLIAYNGSVPSKKYNMFGIRMASQDQHDQQLNSPYKVNNSFITNFEVLGGKAVGIFQAYLPGTVFNNSIFIPHFIHISTSNLSTQNVRANTLTGATVYPNPASANTSVDVVFNLGSTSQVTARIVDINGREVKAFDSKACVAGQNMMNLDIAGITKGMYLVVLESAAGKTTTKLNVQ